MGSKITELFRCTDKFTYSIEVTADLTEEVLNNITLEPLFFTITWHAKLYEFYNLDIAPLKLAKLIANKNKNVLLHLTCHKLRKEYLYSVLNFLKSNDICNLFVIQGEGYNENLSDFKSTSELITSIREYSGDYFCIGVAGHCEKEDSIESLKIKINSGANFILTQAFFDVNVFQSFVAKCKDAGITVPIIPGVFPFETQNEVENFIKLCKIYVDASVMENIRNQSSTEVVKNLVELITKEMDIKHFHFFTMNKYERIEKIIKEISHY